MGLMLSQPRIEISSNVTAVAVFDPPAVRPGEVSIYRVTFNALEESIEWPAEIPAVEGLEMRHGGHGQMLQLAGGDLLPRTSFNCRVRPLTNGGFTVSEFSVKVYGQPVTVPPAHLEAVETPPPGTPALQELILEIPVTNLYAGQATRARVLFQGMPNGMVQGLTQVQLAGQGFIVDQSSVRQRIEVLPRAGARIATYIYETLLTPLTAGRLPVLAQGFTSGMRMSGTVIITGGVTIPGGPPQYTLLDSDPVELEVKPLPRKGELPGFTGAIGHFVVDPPHLATNVVELGEPVKLTVAVRGAEGFARLVAPAPPRARDWQVFAPSTEMAAPQPPQQRNGASPSMPVVATFTYTLMPLSAEAKATPAIPFSCFEPQRGAYVDLTIPAVNLAVQTGSAPADARALLTESMEARGEREPVLSGLARSPGRLAGTLVPAQERPWFTLVQLAPGVAFLGLWGWDRRRRFLEQHPEIVLCRRARRALRRQFRLMHRAARARDGQGFATAAVGAMRVACAPHYPAEPRALVGADVLELLPAAERAAGTGLLVRRFFSVADATRFAVAPADAGELLSLEAEVVAVLQRLEERLRG